MKLKLLFTLFAGLLASQAFAQQNNTAQKSKFSPSVPEISGKVQLMQEAIFIISVKNKKQFLDSINRTEGISVIFSYEPVGIYFIKTTYEMISRISDWENVLFIDINRRPAEELFSGTMDNATNLVNKMQSAYPQYNGNSITLGIKENNFDTSDIDFRGRYLFNPAASQSISSHASVMGTIMAGGGNSWYATKGAAWGSNIISSSFANLLPDANSFFQQYNITVQNNSYGTGIENYYGAEAMAYDLFAGSNPQILHVFSSGNSGTQSPQSGIYSGINGFANLTGNFKMAKNIITVGATDSFYAVAQLSSKGPAFDGRIKPELVALGEDGSSGAAAMVSGTAAALQHAYKSANNGNLPSSALIKAVLINSADDADVPAIDFKSGYGSLNAFKAMETISSGNYISGSVSQAQEFTRILNVPAGINKLKISLVWNDLPAAVNASKALVNDLDMELVNNITLQNWQPWVLSSFPHIDSLNLPAVRKKDSLNNAEQITLDNPSAGSYTIKVKGYAVIGTQSFSIAWQMDTANVFKWNFPTANDPVLAGEQNVLRWKSSLASSPGSVQYSPDGGVSWQIISNNINLSAGYYKWNASLVYSKALLKITSGGNDFISDEFVISKPVPVSVGFNCADSFMLYWPKLNGISQYRVYKLGPVYMEPLSTVSDSSVVFQKNLNPGLHYAVAPVISNREGTKSFAINYTTQGVQCYIKSFFAEKNNSTARLNLELGSLYGVVKIILQKIKGTDTADVQTISSPTQPIFVFFDNNLTTGLQQYRVCIEITGGTKIYSDITPLYFADADNLFVFPNPVKKGEVATVVLSQSHSGELQLTDMFGRIVQRWKVTTDLIPVPTEKLQPGVYLLRLAGYGRKIKAGRLIVF